MGGHGLQVHFAAGTRARGYQAHIRPEVRVALVRDPGLLVIPGARNGEVVGVIERAEAVRVLAVLGQAIPGTVDVREFAGSPLVSALGRERPGGEPAVVLAG